MRAFIFTSKRPTPHSIESPSWAKRSLLRRAGVILAVAANVFAFSVSARADDPAKPAGDSKEDKTSQPEEDDFQSSPFTEYGEFNEAEEEAADTNFLQNGRLFGVSIGTGVHGVTGNRGLLWQGGFPMVDFKVHYWFDFNTALDLDIFSVNHHFDVPSRGYTDINIVMLGVDLKYYFETKNLSAAITFANPYLLAGIGNYTKAEVPRDEGAAAVEKDNTFGLSAGAGLEFAIKPRKSYFTFEAKVHYVSYSDIGTTNFSDPKDGGLPNLNGLFYSFVGSFLFTW